MNIRTAGANMSDNRVKLPEVMVFAGPNGSGKSTITRMARTAGEYINADDIKKTTLCGDLEAAVKAEALRESMVERRADFTFETVLSTDRNLNLLIRARKNGYFVRGIYVLTSDVNINIARINARVALGGHGVPDDKVRLRYGKALLLVPQLVEVCDILHIYDNTVAPFRIFKKRKDVFYCWENKFWNRSAIETLTGVSHFADNIQLTAST